MTLDIPKGLGTNPSKNDILDPKTQVLKTWKVRGMRTHSSQKP